MDPSGKVVPLLRKKVVPTVIKEPDCSWIHVENFMGYSIPQALKMNFHGVLEYQTLSRGQIADVLHEEPPFMNTYKAVILTGGNKLRVLTSSLITEKDCDGYILGRFMVPLLQFCKSMALAGEIIVAFATDGLNVVPMASKTDGIKATSNRIINPPAIILSAVELLGHKGSFCFTRHSAWHGGRQVAKINRAVYNLVPRKMVFRV
jgi:hypothetical protein